MRRICIRCITWLDRSCQAVYQCFPILLVFLVPIHKSVRQIYVEERFVISFLVEGLGIASKCLYLNGINSKVDFLLMQGNGSDRLFQNLSPARRRKAVKGRYSCDEPVAVSPGRE